MPQFTIHEAKTHLSNLIERALSGQEVIIAKRDKPVVRLEALFDELPERELGLFPTLLVEMSHDFDAPLNDFEGYS